MSYKGDKQRLVPHMFSKCGRRLCREGPLGQLLDGPALVPGMHPTEGCNSEVTEGVIKLRSETDPTMPELLGTTAVSISYKSSAARVMLRP